jgi:hypothetical protein
MEKRKIDACPVARSTSFDREVGTPNQQHAAFPASVAKRPVSTRRTANRLAIPVQRPLLAALSLPAHLQHRPL